MKIFVNLYPSRIFTLLKKEEEEEQENAGHTKSLDGRPTLETKRRLSFNIQVDNMEVRISFLKT